MREKKGAQNRKRIILLLFFIVLSPSFFRSRVTVCVCAYDSREGGMKIFAKHFFDIDFFLFSIHNSPSITFFSPLRGEFCILFYEWILWQRRT